METQDYHPLLVGNVNFDSLVKRWFDFSTVQLIFFPLLLLISNLLAIYFKACQYSTLIRISPSSILRFFLATHAACGSQLPNQGLNWALAVESVSPNHWTCREFPRCTFNFDFLLYFRHVSLFKILIPRTFLFFFRTCFLINLKSLFLNYQFLSSYYK